MAAFGVYPRCLLISYTASSASFVALQKTYVYSKVFCIALQAQFLFAAVQLLASCKTKLNTRTLEALLKARLGLSISHFLLSLKPTFSFFINIIMNSEFWEIRVLFRKMCLP